MQSTMRGETEQIRHPNFMRQCNAKVLEAKRSAEHPNTNKSAQEEVLNFLGVGNKRPLPCSKRVECARAEVLGRYKSRFGRSLKQDLQAHRKVSRQELFNRLKEVTTLPAEKVH